MIYIRKKKVPQEIKKKAEEIKNAPFNRYAEIILPRDSNQLRDLFEQMPKDEIRNELCIEQHGLCAYCMKRITSESRGMKIEHYKALSKNKEGALDYKNYLGVCYDGEKEESAKERVLCCDAQRKDDELTINPWDSRQMEAIGYYRSGEIFVRKDVGLNPELAEAMQKDIDITLHLNGIKDEDGRIKSDTASKLVAGRRSVCDSVHTQFERWDKKHKLTFEFLQDKIEKLEMQLQEDSIADEYIGVRLYLYKRKQRKLQRK